MNIFKVTTLFTILIVTGISSCKKKVFGLENKASLDSAYIESIQLPDSINYIFIHHGEICLSGVSEEYKESIYSTNLDSSFITPIILKKYPRLKISSKFPCDSTTNYVEIELWANILENNTVCFFESSYYKSPSDIIEKHINRDIYFKLINQKWTLDSIYVNQN